MKQQNYRLTRTAQNY